MRWLDKEIVLNTISIDIAVLIFSILSLLCSIITIVIYLKKKLRSIIYKLFFHIAINETISRAAHIFTFITKQTGLLIFFDINTILIYFTDTNILIFISYSCYSIFELILKQNKKINNQFTIFLYITYIVSVLLTGLFFFLSYYLTKSRDNELYKNVIALNFIKDTNEANKGKILCPLLITSIIYFLLVVYSFYKVIVIQIFIMKRGEIDDAGDAKAEDKKIQKSLKLKSFKNKMMQYPFLGLFFFGPLMTYSYIEYFKNKEDKEKLTYLQIRYIFYNIYCFMNSIRGWMFFRVFISNEKIKMYLFDKYLTSSVFYSIDKISLKRERRLISPNEPTITNITTNDSFLMDNSFGSSDKISNSSRISEEKIFDEDQEKLIEPTIKDIQSSDSSSINNSEDDN
jgi:hypothetical protein